MKPTQIFLSSEFDSPCGALTMASDGTHLLGLWIKGQKYFLGTLSEKPIINDGLEIFHQTKDWLNRYFRGEKPAISELALAPMGSDFRQQVWKLLCELPYGEVTTYGELAQKVAAIQGKTSMSAQAVGGAVGHNPISIIIPCHRVVGTNGSLTGYAGGIDKKIKLLEVEGVNVSAFSLPK